MFQSNLQSFASSSNNPVIPSRHPLNLPVAGQPEMISLASPPQPQLPITLLQSNNSSPSSPTAPTTSGPHPFQDNIVLPSTSRVAPPAPAITHSTPLHTITEASIFSQSPVAAPVPRSPRQNRAPRIVWSQEHYSAEQLLQQFKNPILVNTSITVAVNNRKEQQQHEQLVVPSGSQSQSQPQNGTGYGYGMSGANSNSTSTSTAELTFVLLGAITTSRFELTTDPKRLPSNSACESVNSAHSARSGGSVLTPDSNYSPRVRGRNLEPPIFSTAESTLHLSASTDCSAPVRLVNELTESFRSVAELALHFPRYVQLQRRLELPTRTGTVAVPGQRLELLKRDKKLSHGGVTDFLVVRYAQREIALPFDLPISCVPVPDPNSYTLYDIYRRFPLPQHFLFINSDASSNHNNNCVHNSRETSSTNQQESELELSTEVLGVVASLQQNSRANESHSQSVADVSPVAAHTSSGTALESTPPPPSLFADTLRRPTSDASNANAPATAASGTAPARLPLSQSPLAHARFELERRFSQRLLVGLVANGAGSGTATPSSRSSAGAGAGASSSAHEELNSLLLWHQNPSGFKALRVVFIPLPDRERSSEERAPSECYARQLSTFSSDPHRLSFTVALRRSAVHTRRSVSGSHMQHAEASAGAGATGTGGGSLTIADLALNGSNYAPFARLIESIDLDRFAPSAQLIDLLPLPQTQWQTGLGLSLPALSLSRPPESAQAVLAAAGVRVYSFAEVYGREASSAPPTLIDTNGGGRSLAAMSAEALRGADVTHTSTCACCDNGLPIRRFSTGSNANANANSGGARRF